MNVVELLDKVLESLAVISVKGKEDCGRMYDCIYAIECIKKACMDKTEEEKQEEPKEE